VGQGTHETGARRSASCRTGTSGLILATGGAEHGGAAAYSSGTPAIGGRRGQRAVLRRRGLRPEPRCAGRDRVRRSSTNGLICGAEQHLVVDKAGRRRAARAAARSTARSCSNKQQTEQFHRRGVRGTTADLKMWFVGQSADKLAAAGGVEAAGRAARGLRGRTRRTRRGAQAAREAARAGGCRFFEGRRRRRGVRAVSRPCSSTRGPAHTANVPHGRRRPAEALRRRDAREPRADQHPRSAHGLAAG